MKAKVIVVLLSFFVLLSCMSDDDCFTGDSIDQVKSLKIDKLDHYLFLRTTGFQEKESFYELYNNMPIFDKCGQAENLPISVVHADSSEGQISKLVIDGKNLKIIYDETGRKPNVKLKAVPIKIINN